MITAADNPVAASRTITLSQIQLASPCPARWEEMDGDDRSRFCHQCQKNVYDLTVMSHLELVALIERTEGRFCGRIYARTDGRGLTEDCPVGLARLRRHAKKVRRVCAAAVLMILGLYGCTLTAMASSHELPPAIAQSRFLKTLSRWTFGVPMRLGMMFVPPARSTPPKQ